MATTAIFFAAMGSISWFPPDWSGEFYFLTGVASLCATVLFVWHMTRTWHEMTSRGQCLRHLSLLYFATLITAASVEQTQQHAAVEYRNVGVLVGALLLVVTAVVSLRELRNQ